MKHWLIAFAVLFSIIALLTSACTNTGSIQAGVDIKKWVDTTNNVVCYSAHVYSGDAISCLKQ